ncbi:hypothetical protein G7Y89_g15727 [Cudoniella acicularis]|uniref:Uncharacterized protein n=1 Tax=Cudoniella acicularis TaxID=354080 RepID=A0A8H4VI89_9HELO|nr:hypothetical protein G7Y89_g15727 [Cudoniella acicularis]
MKIILDIIHGRTRDVPRDLSLPELVEVAILVEKYDMQEVTSEMAKEWEKVLQREVRNDVPGPNIASELFISWAFRMEDNFRWYSTSAVIDYSEKEFERILENNSEGLAIPGRILQFIGSKRRSGFKAIFNTLKYWFNGAASFDNIQCARGDQNCEAMFLGTLLRSACRLGVWPPPQDELCPNAYLVEWLTKLRRLEIKTLCHLTRGDARENRAATKAVMETLADINLVFEESEFELEFFELPSEVEE